MQQKELVYIIFTIEGIFEVDIENLPEWDLNLRPPNSVQTLQPTEVSGHEFKSHSEPVLYSYCNFIVGLVSVFI